MKSVKNLITKIKKDMFASLEDTLRPKSVRFFKDRRRRDSDNNYAQFPNYASAPINNLKNDYRLGYQDSHHNIRYLNHSTAAPEKDTILINNAKISKKEILGVLKRFKGKI